MNTPDPAESTLESRACFNEGSHRNLSKYLDLIVRIISPEPTETYALYQQAVDRVEQGLPVRELFADTRFRLSDGEETHDRFWRAFAIFEDRFIRSRRNFFSEVDRIKDDELWGNEAARAEIERITQKQPKSLSATQRCASVRTTVKKKFCYLPTR